YTQTTALTHLNLTIWQDQYASPSIIQHPNLAYVGPNCEAQMTRHLPLALLALCTAAKALTTVLHIGSDPGGSQIDCGGIPLVESSFDAYPKGAPWTMCWTVPHSAGHYVYWENKPDDRNWKCHGAVYNDNKCSDGARIRYLWKNEDCAYTRTAIYSYRVYCN
ncbi:hypothetical protein Tdes44962_MAKER01488, partial [Teratosphaeria destructans]